MNMITDAKDERLEEDRFVNNFADEVYLLRDSLRAALSALNPPEEKGRG